MMAMGYSYPGNAKDILRVASIYVGLKDYKNAEKLYKEVLERDPYNPQIYASLAVNYKEMGDKENAKAMAEKAMALDPSYADEGKAFVDSLK